jgi:acetoin utilization protein AcuB
MRLQIEPIHTRRRVRMKDVMTSRPITIGRSETLATAHAIMRKHGVRHLPVLEHNELVGVVSQRDLYLLESLPDVDRDVDRVETAMTSDVYRVGPDEPLGAVCARMAERRLGCAVILERERVIGIFTSTDALRFLGRPS